MNVRRIRAGVTLPPVLPRMSDTPFNGLDLRDDAPDASPPSPPGLTTRVVHSSFLNLGGQGVTMVATLVATPFVIRLLGPASYGVLALIHVLIGYLSVADLGMGTAS